MVLMTSIRKHEFEKYIFRIPIIYIPETSELNVIY